MTTHQRRIRLGAAAAVLAALAIISTGSVPSASADTYVTVTGSGSTWSQVALDAWSSDVRSNGIQIDYTGNGSTAGRLDFIKRLSDFAVSEIPFQSRPEDGSLPEVSPRPFAYLPIVAGGTSFMYHLTLAGRRVTDLRLSGETITQIFTGVIRNWSDPAITRDYGRQLPNEAITPVLRSDGSGTSAQFTLYMSKRYPTLWNSFCVRYARATPPCGLFSFYPQFPGSKAQSGSNNVSNYVAASYGEGAITYVEYAYAQNLGYPVVKVLNAANYYTGPTPSNVAVALTRAVINTDLTQNLDQVYANTDPRAYPLSSYSYMIVPIDTASPFNTDKGKTLSTFINYFLCAGQQKAPTLGYSPLPLNLVQAAFAQVRRIPGNVGTPDTSATALQSCHNPTFFGGRNTLLLGAAYPAACDKAGAPPCGGGGSAPTTPGRSSSGAASTRVGASAADRPAAGTGTGGSVAAPTSPGASGLAPGGKPSGPAAVDPETGRPVGGPATNATATDLAGGAVDVAATRQSSSGLLYGLTALELILVILMPPVLAGWLRRRSST